MTATDTATHVRVVRGEVEVRNRAGRRRLWTEDFATVRRGESPRLVERLRPIVLPPL